MKQFLVVGVLHRLDRRTVLTTIDISRNRPERIVIDTNEIASPILPGLVFEMKLSYRSGRPQLVYSRPVGHTAESVRMAVDRGMIGGQLGLPRAIKKLIHQRANAISDWLNLADISQRTAPINEPYATLIWLESSDQRQDLQTLMELISTGLNQQQAERYQHCYGVDAPSHLAASPETAWPFCNIGTTAFDEQRLVATESTSNSLELVRWLQSRADRGHTLCDRVQIPKRLRAALGDCVTKRLVHADGTKAQLSSHAILQTRLREKLEKLTSNFYPTYGEPELEFAYSRLAGLSGGATTDFYAFLTELVNQRVVMLTYSSMAELAAIIEQYSALIQTLHWNPPQILAYSQRRASSLAKWLPYEEIAPFYETSRDQTQSGQSRIVIDFDQFTLSDMVVLLEGVGKDDQLILVSNHAALPLALSREFYLQHLRNYFHTVELSRRISPPEYAKVARPTDINDAIENGYTVISDDLYVIQQVNSRPKASGALKLVTVDGCYSKNEPILFQPIGPRQFDSFIGTVMSTSDKGLTVNVAGVVRLLSDDFVTECRTSRAYGIDIFDAARVGLNRGVLLTSDYHGVSEYLRELGTEIARHYSLPQRPDNVPSPSGQRITPLVEGRD